MTEKKSAAELRALADKAEWEEYQAARLAKQLERVASYEARSKEVARKLAEAKASAASIQAEIASGVVGTVRKAVAGGVNIGVPSGALNLRGN